MSQPQKTLKTHPGHQYTFNSGTLMRFPTDIALLFGLMMVFDFDILLVYTKERDLLLAANATSNAIMTI